MFSNKSNDRAQVGIGTLIVFIAMVLVAAIAAGVLINTAGMLQTQAEATGEESTDLVSERIDVNTEVGVVGSASEGYLSSINITVTGAAGADEIDLNETIIQAVGPDGQETLTLDDDRSEGTVASATDVDHKEFGVMNSSNQWVDADNAVLGAGDNDEFTIVLNPDSSPFGDEQNGVNAPDFGEGDDSTLDIVSPSGATTQVELRAPDLFNDDGEAVRL